MLLIHLSLHKCYIARVNLTGQYGSYRCSLPSCRHRPMGAVHQYPHKPHLFPSTPPFFRWKIFSTVSYRFLKRR